MSIQTHFLKRGVLTLVAVMLAFPLLAKAEDFGSVALAKSGKVTLTAQASGFSAKGGSINAPSGATITLTWTVPADWKGCYSNWQESVIVGNGSKTATINNTQSPKGRVFVMTCYGVGQAQTVAVKVNIIKPDISIARFSVVGAEPIPAKAATAARPAIPEKKDANGRVIQAAVPAVPAVPAVQKNTYKAGAGALSLSAVLKNTGRTSVPETPAVMVAYEEAQTRTPTAAGTIWQKRQEVGLEGNFAIAPGATSNVTVYRYLAGPGGPLYFRIRADSTGVVDESNESNNTKIVGPFYFR